MNFKHSLLLSALGLCACAGTASVPPDPFGSAVRNMQYEQTLDPRAAAQPPANAPDTIDGERAAQVLKTYRSGGKTDAAAQETILIQEP
jgi:type IV pilus biogenesis protein CpaD/CtpE